MRKFLVSLEADAKYYVDLEVEAEDEEEAAELAMDWEMADYPIIEEDCQIVGFYWYVNAIEEV